MAVIEITTFRIDGPEQEFLAADRRVQEWFAHQQPGMLRRTTARGAGGLWAVVELWADEESADRAERAAAEDAHVRELRQRVVEGTWAVQRFTTLD